MMFRKNKRLRQKNKKNLVKNKNAKKPPQKDSLCARALFRSLSLRYVQHWVQGVPIPVADGNRGVACASAAVIVGCGATPVWMRQHSATDCADLPPGPWYRLYVDAPEADGAPVEAAAKAPAA